MTVRSMTGFANASGECAGKRIDLEIRSVNHRFLDTQFKIPDDLRSLEGAMRELISSKVSRGKLECRIQLNNLPNSAASLHINHNLVAELADLNAKWRKKHDDLAKLSVADILRFPGVIASADVDGDELADAVMRLLAQALDDFVASREREGEKLHAHIVERLDLMDSIVSALEELFPSLLNAHMERSRHRLAEAVSNIDDDRLKLEFALFMQKADVDEEFSRLHGHITEVRRIVDEHNGTIGKRLDFLMQELNREANTLGSKAIATECTQVSVELKVLIEQMREQVQNIE
ncbi:YicC/YloC family endoribonuclease [Kingella negevensis]|uniref:YicC/YloC family endoribonuclease n=1 Tax=Kingella negevensis TaxID=1522312 RepID=UPI00050A1CE9|nr:YicC/YloC family endoribonuclease [Kingella negevensis]MDK4688223.1 YicC family protein [Kingella negevensis]WII91843.1 YicC family protein [Kingella negevensis]